MSSLIPISFLFVGPVIKCPKELLTHLNTYPRNGDAVAVTVKYTPPEVTSSLSRDDVFFSQYPFA